MPELVRLLTSRAFLEHLPPHAHPENPERILPLLEAIESDPQLLALTSSKMTSPSTEILYRLHSREMVDQVLDRKGRAGWFDADTYYSEKSVETALLAAGACIDLALSIWRGDVRRGFSIVRPPGHHATKDEPMGFCLLNNVALAVAAVKAESPNIRVAVIDFDLHHGNGTQWIFYDDPNVLFLSSHRYPYYPGTGGLDEMGAGKGLGTSVNFPLANRYPDALFQSLYGQIVPAILKGFAPEMIFVSAGFDGHIEDPMRGFAIHTETYGELAETLIQCAETWARGRILFCLEGGYHPPALRDSALQVIRRMQQVPVGEKIIDRSTKDIFPEIDRFRKHFRPVFATIP